MTLATGCAIILTLLISNDALLGFAELFVFFFRGVLVSEYPKTAAAGPNPSPQHHIPDVPLPPQLRRLVLSQRRHLFHRQDTGQFVVQLHVSTIHHYYHSVKINSLIMCRCAEGYQGSRCEYKDLDGSYIREYNGQTSRTIGV